MINNIYLDHAAATPLSETMKQHLISVLDLFGNPSSLHSAGRSAAQIIAKSGQSIADFLHARPEDICFTPSGSASNTLAVRGLTSENPQENRYEVFYSPTAHKSMIKACESCLYHKALQVNAIGEIDPACLENMLTECSARKPLVCIEAASSEIGTVQNVADIGAIVHRHHGILAVDVTGYLPSYRIDLEKWKDSVDLLTFSGHKLRALKGIGVLWKRKELRLKPLIYGSQQNGILGGTENVVGIASLGKAVEEYDYSSISSAGRNYVYHYINKHIPDSFLVGAPVAGENRLPCNLCMCFRGVEGESLMSLLDVNGIRVSTGSACNNLDSEPSHALRSIGMKEPDIHSCIRMSFCGRETPVELNYICEKLRYCVDTLRKLNPDQKSSRKEETFSS